MAWKKKRKVERKVARREGSGHTLKLSFPVDVDYIHFSVLCNAIAVSLRLLVRFLCFFSSFISSIYLSFSLSFLSLLSVLILFRVR